MANIPPLKKVIPTSPDQIQKFSSEAEGAIVKMSHLNRALLYIGNEISIQTISMITSPEIFAIKPCGFIKLTDLDIGPGSRDQIKLIFNPSMNNIGAGVFTPAFVQLTSASSENGVPFTLHAMDINIITDGVVIITISNVSAIDSLTEIGFYYTIIPQLL